MNQFLKLNNVLGLVVCLGLIVSCGDDDGDPNPPPMVDCNTSGPVMTLTGTASTGCGEDDGMVDVDITGGNGALTVTIDPQPVGVNFDAANSMFTDVEPGDYTVEVVDDEGCTTSGMVTIGFPAANLSYQTDIDPIIQASCAISNCHDGSTTLPDFTDFATLQARANNQSGGVRQRVKTGDMPRSGSLNAEEIAAILCWIDEGAQNN